MRLVKFAVIAGLLLAPSLAFAQMSKIIIGGVDQRIPPIENQILAQQVAEKTQQLARAAAMLSLEQQEQKEAEERATATKAWLDEAWKGMEYWRAYAGVKP